MRLNINLASEPFQPNRPLIAASVAVGLALAALLAALVSLAVLERSSAAETRQTIARLEERRRQLEREQAELEQTLKKPENAEVLNTVLFLNSLLYRKGISWTRVFDDLEAVMPYNVRLISIRPQVDARGAVELDMVVGAQSQLPVIEMLKRMERNPVFGSTAVHNWLPPTQTEPYYRYRVTVTYGQQL